MHTFLCSPHAVFWHSFEQYLTVLHAPQRSNWQSLFEQKAQQSRASSLLDFLAGLFNGARSACVALIKPSLKFDDSQYTVPSIIVLSMIFGHAFENLLMDQS